MGDSGHFVLARWTQEDKTEIEMTAFKVSMMTMTAGKMVLQWFFGLCLFTKLSHNQFGYIWIIRGSRRTRLTVLTALTVQRLFFGVPKFYVKKEKLA